ncbi:kinesin light chain [Emiliania huxleyi CCMP1516]|uniref:Kinesin light chain n=2 Tax=Emiliania huxleyi TaxID=2903 RepID=A0A0D3I129_EMIH1|nr:kinesin light chain [Emiliania huxleyi CCMP1516]EOD04964.1 kinesin light chain [Emiliania huxleyi CCMP1516]|eukprot:XP_005757393.1 kinesin light chain [Emiliania huxleyi CCMP1516]
MLLAGSRLSSRPLLALRGRLGAASVLGRRGLHLGVEADPRRMTFVDPTVPEETPSREREEEQELRSLNGMAQAYREAGDLTRAEAYFARVLARRRALHGSDDPRTLYAMGHLTAVLAARGSLHAAVTLAKKQCAASLRTLGPCHPDTLLCHGHAVSLLSQVGRHEEAEETARLTHSSCAAYHGEAHPTTLIALSQLGQALIAVNKLDEAETCLRTEAQSPHISPYLRHASAPKRNLPISPHISPYLPMSPHISATPPHRSAISPYLPISPHVALSTDSLGGSHPETRIACSNLASALVAQARVLADAMPDLSASKLSEAEALFRAQLDACDTLTAQEAHARVLGHLSRYEEAVALLRASRGEAHPATLALMAEATQKYHDEGRPSQAEPLARELVAACARRLGEGHTLTVRYSWMLAVLLRQQGKGDEAAAITGEWGALPSDLPASLPTARGHKPAPHSVVDYVELGQFSHTLQTVSFEDNYSKDLVSLGHGPAELPLGGLGGGGFAFHFETPSY